MWIIMGIFFVLFFVHMFLVYKTHDYTKNEYPDFWKAYNDPKNVWKRNQLWAESESIKNDLTLKKHKIYGEYNSILILLSFVAMIFYFFYFW